MIEVRLQFSSMAEAANFFHSAAVNGSAPIATLPAGAVISPAPAGAIMDVTLTQGGTIEPAAGIEVVEKKTTRTKKTAVKDPASPAPGEPEPKSPLNTEAPKPTIDDVRTALGDLVARKNFETGTELVRTFLKADGQPAARLSELQEADWVSFIEKAKAA